MTFLSFISGAALGAFVGVVVMALASVSDSTTPLTEKGSPAPSEKEAREAAAIIKVYCENRDSDPECDCLQCPIRDICDSDPYSWDV